MFSGLKERGREGGWEDEYRQRNRLIIFHQNIESRKCSKPIKAQSLPPVIDFLQEGSPPKGSLPYQTAPPTGTKHMSLWRRIVLIKTSTLGLICKYQLIFVFVKMLKLIR